MTVPATTAVEPLATNCYFVGNGSRADAIWSREDFLTVCNRMRNGNSPQDFLLVYRDNAGEPKFAKARNVDVQRRIEWAWDSITGSAKIKAGIGFYPRDGRGRSFWGAMDFDAHDGDKVRPRDLALKAFAILGRHPDLFLLLGTSGDGGGWHLFVFCEHPRLCTEWAKLLREVAEKIGAPVKKGSVEIFPSDARGKFAIRAPGTWNPKDDSFGLVVADRATARLQGFCLPKEACSLCTRSTTQGSLPSREALRITAPGTRWTKLAALTATLFFQTGHAIARRGAEQQHVEADPAPQTSLNEHLAEFAILWSGMQREWLAGLKATEIEKFDSLTTEWERDAFRILRNWRNANPEAPDFKIHCKTLAERLGITLQGASAMRRRFCSLGILNQTAPYERYRLAARYVWLPR